MSDFSGGGLVFVQYCELEVRRR